MEFYSHLDRDSSGRVVSFKLLRDHLRDVREVCGEVLGRLPLVAELRGVLVELGELVGGCHDFGKFTSFFQNYLQKGGKEGLKKNHSLISALWAAYSCFRKKGIGSFWEAALVFGVVHHHHGKLENSREFLVDDLYYFRKNKANISPKHKESIAVLRSQVEDILGRLSSLEKEVFFPLPYKEVRKFGEDFLDFGDFYHYLEEVGEFLEERAEEKAERFWRKFNFCLHLLFSVLVDMDRRDASKTIKRKSEVEIPPSIVEKHIRSKYRKAGESELLHSLRNAIFSDLSKRAEEALPRILTLTAPTGSGKTLASFHFALKLRERIQRKRGYRPKIIYALPFTSIIDQNFEIFRQIFDQYLEGFSGRETEFLLKHHYYSSAEYKADGEEFSLDQSMLLIEAWESEVIVTTFVQLFSAILSRTPATLKRFHNIVGSIILLDEVQSLPLKYWTLLEKVFRWLCDYGRCYLVMMSATQPLIFNPDEVEELVHSVYFDKLNRVKIEVFIEKEQKLEEFSEEFLRGYQQEKSYCLILNTISSSQIVFHKLKEGGVDNLFYLSGSILPVHRKIRIEEIRRALEEGEAPVLVTTQVIEAGVDLDFDIIYRDLAPLDALVQAAGRSNRHGRRRRGIVRFVHLINEEKVAYGKMIYGKAHLSVAMSMLGKTKEIEEREFYKMILENYESLVRKQDFSEGEEIWDRWQKEGDYSVIDKFQLIEEKQPRITVFLEIDGEAEEIWHHYYHRVYLERDYRRKRENFLKIRQSFRQYTLSIPMQNIRKAFWDYCGGKTYLIGYVRKEIANDIYDPTTGLRALDEESHLIL